MTKEEILATIHNHKDEIKVALNNLAATVESMSKGSIPAEHHSNIIDGLKATVDFVKGKCDEIKSALGQWPE